MMGSKVFLIIRFFKFLPQYSIVPSFHGQGINNSAVKGCLVSVIFKI